MIEGKYCKNLSYQLIQQDTLVFNVGQVSQLNVQRLADLGLILSNFMNNNLNVMYLFGWIHPLDLAFRSY